MSSSVKLRPKPCLNIPAAACSNESSARCGAGGRTRTRALPHNFPWPCGCKVGGKYRDDRGCLRSPLEEPAVRAVALARERNLIKLTAHIDGCNLQKQDKLNPKPENWLPPQANQTRKPCMASDILCSEGRRRITSRKMPRCKCAALSGNAATSCWSTSCSSSCCDTVRGGRLLARIWEEPPSEPTSVSSMKVK